MITYRDLITMDDEDIDNAEDFFLLPAGSNKYIFRALSKGADIIPQDPGTQLTKFWLITRQQVNMNKSNKILFPYNSQINHCELRNTPMTTREVQQVFGFDPVQVKPDTFSVVPPTIQRMSINVLIGLLNSPNTGVRLKRFAVMQLARRAGQNENLNGLHEHLVIRSLIPLLNSDADLPSKRQAILVLVSFLASDPDTRTKKLIALLLCNMTEIYVCQKYIREAQGIPAIVLLLSSADLPTVQLATRALANLATNDKNRRAILCAPGIQRLKLLVNSADEETRDEVINILTFLRKPVSAVNIAPHAAMYRSPNQIPSDDKRPNCAPKPGVC